MAVASGSRLGPYEVSELLGSGGMGEVYRARDTRLEREVAIKILPLSLTGDSDRFQRFQAEARLVAALEHPSILHLHDIGECEGAPYLVCELLEGETLRERLRSGALPQRKAIEFGKQIAEGLAAAHDRGIIHRDLKPENIFVTKDGRIKILDFGLAKLQRTQGASAGHEATLAEVTIEAHTTPGVVLGTVGYMSPEQVRGQAVDARSDIFSFGAVLYEMLTGSRAFKGESSIETMNAILKEDPPELTISGSEVSPGLERVMRRCLEKKREERFQSARDLAFSLDSLSGVTTKAAVPVQSLGVKPRVLWVAFGLVIAAVAIASSFYSRDAKPKRTQYFAIPVDREVSHLAISADGAKLAYVGVENKTGHRMIFVQDIGSQHASPLAGTDNATFPFWSPDDTYVAYFANRKLMKVAVAGGPPQELARVSNPRGGTWGSKNVIIFNAQAGGPLLRVNADGTGLGPLTEKMMTPTESAHRWPQFLPDGNHFIFWAGNFSRIGNQNGIWISSLDSDTKRFVQQTYSNAAYVEPNKLVYVGERGQVLMQDFDADKGTTQGEAKVISEGLAYDSSLYWAAFTVSENGIMVSNTSAAASQSQLTWVDRTGNVTGTVGGIGLIFNPSISPEGTRVAADIDDVATANVDIWIQNFASGTATRFTFGADEQATPVWSPDGKLLAFRSTSNLMLKPSSGLEKEKIWVPRTVAAVDRLPNSWTPDGKSLVYTTTNPDGTQSLMIAKPNQNTGVPLFTAKSNQSNGQISADGKWLAYASDESGVWEIYVTDFPGLGGKWQVSHGGGTEPRWRHDGKELFYVDSKGMLIAVPISTVGGFSVGVPQELFPLGARMALSSTDRFSYDVTADGKRFLVNRYVSPKNVNPLEIAIGITASDKSK